MSSFVKRSPDPLQKENYFRKVPHVSIAIMMGQTKKPSWTMN